MIGLHRKTLISVIKYAGSESYEMRFSLLVGISSSILSFFILSVPESVLNFGFHEGRRSRVDQSEETHLHTFRFLRVHFELSQRVSLLSFQSNQFHDVLRNHVAYRYVYSLLTVLCFPLTHKEF